MPTLFGFARGSIEYYGSLLTVVFSGQFRKDRFFEVAEKAFKNQFPTMERATLDAAMATLQYSLTENLYVQLAEGSSWEDVVREMEDIVLLDGLKLVCAFCGYHYEPWCFRSAAQALGRLCSIRPRKVMPIIRKLGSSRNDINKQCSALAFAAAAELSAAGDVVCANLDLLSLFVSDAESKKVRQYGRQAVKSCARTHLHEILNLINTWRESSNSRLRQSAALLMGEDFVPDTFTAKHLIGLQNDEDDVVRRYATMSTNVRNYKQTPAGNLEEVLRSLWEIEDEAEFGKLLLELRCSTPEDVFWKAVREVVVQPFLDKADFNDVKKCIHRLQFSHKRVKRGPAFANTVTNIASAFVAEWRKNPVKIRDMFVDWYLHGNANTLFTQNLKKQSRDFAILTAEVFSFVYANHTNKRSSLIGMLEGLILGKIATFTQDKANLARNLRIVIKRLYEIDPVEIGILLRKWLKADDLSGLHVAISTIIELGAAQRLNPAEFIGQALSSDARTRTDEIYKTLRSIAREESLKESVVQSMCNLITHPDQLIRTRSITNLIQIQKAIGTGDEICLLKIRQVAIERNVNIGESVRETWSPEDSIFIIGMCLSGVVYAKEILDICSTLDGVTSNDGEMERNGAILMCRRYVDYKRGRDKLASVGYFCLTVSEELAGNRKAASKRYGIDLSKLGRLTSEQGGEDSRKAMGIKSQISETDRDWIDKVLLILIRRIAEHACDPSASIMKLK